MHRMILSEGIRKHGFRKWYERELLASHAYLVLAFVSAIALFAAFEALAGVRTTGDRIADIVCILASAGVGVWALRRYLYLLMHAENAANQAECPHCRAYARFTLVRADDASVDVRCGKCEQQWRIDA